MTSERVLGAAEVQAALSKMATQLTGQPEKAPLAIIAIRRGGEAVARRLASLIESQTGTRPPVGTVDITLYRDDGFAPGDWPEVGITNIPFDVSKHTVALVDDVLYTGRTVRAAIDVVLDYGRPAAIRLATLVDRGLREFPIRADAVGHEVQTSREQHVQVSLQDEASDDDHVLVQAQDSST